jgi:hypothetical protein
MYHHQIIRTLCIVGILFCVGFMSQNGNAAEFSWNGFASLHGTKALQGDIYDSGLAPSNGQPSFIDGSLLGLNIRADMDEEWAMIVQLLASGDWKVQADWFYLIYNPVEGLNLKLGRQIFPMWLVSEFIDVGFTYPWRQPSNLVYTIAPFKSFNGVSVDYRYALSSEISLTSSLFGGNEKITFATTSPVVSTIVDANNLIGATLTLDGDGWRVRGAVARLHAKISTYTGTVIAGQPLVLTDTTDVSMYTLGARYDKNNVVAYAEYGTSRGSNSTTAFTGQPFLDYISGTHATLGYRIKEFLPFYSIAYGDWKLGFPGSTGTAVQQTIGLNYQASESVVVKALYDSQRSPDGLQLSRPGIAETISLGADVVF